MAVTPKKKLKNLKNLFLDTNSINIYAKLQVSRFNGVARMEVRNVNSRIYMGINPFTTFSMPEFPHQTP